MDTLVIVLVVIVVFRLFAWAQAIYWSSPAFQDDLKREDSRHGSARHA